MIGIINMKILHIIIGLNQGGAEESLKRLVFASHSEQYQHIIISLTTLGVVGNILRDEGIDVYCLDLNYFYQLPNIFFKLIKLTLSIRPNIIQTWMYHADLLGGITGFLLRKPVIWGVRNTHATYGNGTSKSTQIIMKICAILSWFIPKKVVCVADAAIYSHSKYGYKKSIMLNIPNGYDIELINRLANKENRLILRTQLGIDENNLVIGSVGRFNDYKDYPNFVKAINELQKNYQYLKILMVGRNINKSNIELMDLISKTNYPDQFILLDEQKNPAQYVACMDIFCLHSASEGFPNVLAEAMSLSILCVTTDVGDARIIINNDEYVVPSKNSFALAKKIEQLINLSDIDKSFIGSSMHNNIVSKYSIQTIKLAYENLYHSIISKK
jgi:glycosyltransferase involved in cell wall biosynthesis